MNALKLAELVEKLSDAKADLESAGRAHSRAESDLRYARREKEMDAWKVYGPLRGDYFRAKRATSDAYDNREATAIDPIARAITEARREGHKAGRIEMREEAAAAVRSINAFETREFSFRERAQTAIRILPDTPADRPPA